MFTVEASLSGTRGEFKALIDYLLDDGQSGAPMPRRWIPWAGCPPLTSCRGAGMIRNTWEVVCPREVGRQNSGVRERITGGSVSKDQVAGPPQEAAMDRRPSMDAAS